MNPRTLKILAATALTVAAGVLGFRSWRDHVIRVRDESAFKAARRAIEEHRPTDALALYQAQDHSRSPLPWDDIELAACAGTRQLPRLIALYEQTPERILRNETASQLVARTFLHSRRPKDRARIREVPSSIASTPTAVRAPVVDDTRNAWRVPVTVGA